MVLDIDAIARDITRRDNAFVDMRQAVLDAGTDNLGHFGNGYVIEGQYSLQQNPDEFAAAVLFLQTLQLNGGSYLEIGAASGGTCRFICERIAFKRIAVIDDRSHARWKEQFRNFGAMKVRPEMFVGDSHSAAAAAWVQRNGLVDLAFIDGDHSYDGCKKDFEMMRPLARYVMFHDIVACDGVKSVWNDAIALRQLEPLARLIGTERPLGIGIGRVL